MCASVSLICLGGPFLVQYYDKSCDQIPVSKVFMNFTGNRAAYASAVFINDINVCSWVQHEEPFFDEDRAFQWNFTTLSLVKNISMNI